ncbi:MAG: fumarate hydratase [Euryarchaeota archaeon]|nr:fumarate hydratase [Euryarchaeota archaeon]
MTLTRENVITATIDIIKQAETILPDDVVEAIRMAEAIESSPVARSQLQAILQNIDLAGRHAIPMCQDTGILIFFVEIGRKLVMDLDLEDAIIEATRIATETVPLRPNAVDPLKRTNSNNNIGAGMPDIKYAFNDSDELTITVAPKGAGSENMSALKMLNPTEVDSIRTFVLETVLNAGGMPCPPIIVGVGIGGSFDKAARLAKAALLEDVSNMDEFEKELLNDINSLGIGPMGLGGDTTALAVHTRTAYCHTASLPVAVNIQCWANRHASVTLGGGR